MAIFANSNPHISKVALPPPTKFGTLVEAHGLHLGAKARWDRANHFCAATGKVHQKRQKMPYSGCLIPRSKKTWRTIPNFFTPYSRGVTTLSRKKNSLVKMSPISRKMGLNFWEKNLEKMTKNSTPKILKNRGATVAISVRHDTYRDPWPTYISGTS